MEQFSDQNDKSSQSSNDTRISESIISAIFVVVGDPNNNIAESDAIVFYANKNPSWSRKQPVNLLRIAKFLPVSNKGLTECASLVLKSDILKSIGPCNIIVQTATVDIVNKNNIEEYDKTLIGIFTCFQSSNIKNTLVMSDDSAIEFKPDEDRYRFLHEKP